MEQVMLITDKDVKYIKEVASQVKGDYMNIQSNNIQVSFSKLSEVAFKTYTVPAKGMGLFNLRIPARTFASILKEGYMGIVREDSLYISISKDLDAHNRQDYSTSVAMVLQSDEDFNISKLLNDSKNLSPKDGLVLYHPEVLTSLNSMAKVAVKPTKLNDGIKGKVSAKGVAFSPPHIFTEGPGFKAFVESESLRFNMVVGVEALDQISKTVKTLKRDKEYEDSFIIWNVDNYIFFKEGTLVHAFRKNVNKLALNIEALNQMQPELEFQMDLTDVVRQLKELSFSEASNVEIEYDLASHYFTITDKGRSVVRTRIVASTSYDLKLKFSPELIKNTLTALYNKETPIFKVRAYTNVIHFISQEGINLIVGREG